MVTKKTMARESALERAQQIGEQAALCGFDWEDVRGPLKKVREEIDELEAELDSGESSGERLFEELGDLLFSVVNLARHLDCSAEAALEMASDKFEERLEAVFARVEELGSRPEELDLEELEAIWQQVKEKE